jgi:hypothetical protein
VTIAKRPCGGRDVSGSTPKQNFCKYEYFGNRRLTQRWRVLPVGQHKGSWPSGGRPHPISVNFDGHVGPDILHGVARRAMLSIIEPELFEGFG